jgi:large repetitive protein
MKIFKLLLLLISTAFAVSNASAQANAYINILTQNSGQVNLGGTAFIEVTVGNTGPVSSIGVNKVRAQVSVPSAIVSIPTTGHVLPAGWTVTVNTGSAITVCNGSDVIAVGTARTILINVQGNTLGGPSTVTGNLLFSSGTSCTAPGSLPGDNTADNSSTSSIQVIAGCPLTVTAAAGTIACNGGTTTLTATATGATGAVEYSLNGGAFQSSNTFTVNATGSPYTVSARQVSTPTCSATAPPVTVTEPAAVPAPTVSVVQPTCTVSSGTITITFSLDGGPYAAYPAAGYLVVPGAHTLKAQNAATCTSAVTNITVNAGPPVPTAPAVGAITQPTCAVSTGSVVLSGLPSGDWTINPGAIAGNTPTTNINGLAAATYNFTVTNADGCTSPASADVIINPVPGAPAAPTVSVVQPTCTSATGIITVTSATAGLTFSIDGGAYAPYPAGGYTGLVTGPHTLTLQNAAGCTSPVTNITINAQPPTPSAPTVSATNPTCTVATGTITITSVTAGLTFSLDGGTYATYPAGGYITAAGPHTLTAQNASGCISSVTNITVDAPPQVPASPTIGVTTQPTCLLTTGSVVLNGLPSGNWTINPGTISGSGNSVTINGLSPATTYTFTVTNASGCTSAASANVVINPVAGAPAAPVVNVVQPTCTIATGTITITSATTALTFSIDGGAYTTYPAGGYAGIAAGTHTLTAQNASNCISPVTNITINAQPPTPSAPTVSTVQPTCTTATGIITVTSATTGLTFSIDGGAYAAYPAGGYATIPGMHTLSAQNSSGCISPVINITIDPQPAALTAATTAAPITCFGANTTLTVTASGGTAPYQYSLNGGAFQTLNTFTVPAAAHNITVKDVNLCTTTAAVTVNQPTAITATAAAGTIACNGGTSTLTVTASGGTAPLQYSLNNSAFQQSNTFTVGAGTQTVTVKDANGCTKTAAAVTVSQPGTLTAAATAPRITTCGGSTPVTVTASGGRAPFTGIGTYTKGPGTWAFTVTDAGGCTATANITIEAPGCMDLKVFPNPAKNSISINHSVAEPGSIIQVFDITGKLAISKIVADNLFLTTIDISKLSLGSYLVVFINGKDKKTTLFVKAGQ